jgi:hypothetical protein
MLFGHFRGERDDYDDGRWWACGNELMINRNARRSFSNIDAIRIVRKRCGGGGGGGGKKK